MNLTAIREKFGDDYWADEYTHIMGIDQRFTNHFAERFNNLKVLETCTGGGFTTISLAKITKHVFTVEVDQFRHGKAMENIQKAGLLSNVSFICGSILDPEILKKIPKIDAAFIDPDWAVTGPDHVYRFKRSNTQPPADIALKSILELTENVAIVLPPFVDIKEFDDLPEHEREKLYLGESHELFCLYFGKLKILVGETEFHVKT